MTVSTSTPSASETAPEHDSADGHVVDGQIEISIVMPCLNESQTVGICVSKAFFSLKQAGPTTLSSDGRRHPPRLRTWRDGWRPFVSF